MPFEDKYLKGNKVIETNPTIFKKTTDRFKFMIEFRKGSTIIEDRMSD